MLSIRFGWLPFTTWWPSGSLILALAVTRGRLSAAEAFDLSRIDESWQAEFWGADEDAAALEVGKRQALLEAERFYALCL